MKNFLIIILLFCFIKSSAQKEMIGVYKFPNQSTDGLGGSSLALLENQKFVFTTYATMIVGKWEVAKNKPNTLLLLPLNPDGVFQVFGRKNPDLGSSTSIIFSVEAEDEVYFGTDPYHLKRILKTNSDLASPKILKLKNRPLEFYLLEGSNSKKRPEVFNSSGFNEFLIEYFSAEKKYPTMEFRIVKGGLQSYDLQNTVAKREPLPHGEKYHYLDYAEHYYRQVYCADFKLLNTDYKNMDNLLELPNLSEYQFNPTKNQYEAKVKNDMPNEYFKRDVLRRYDKIKPQKNTANSSKVIDGSVF